MGRISWLSLGVESIHCPSTDLPQMPPSSAHAHNRRVPFESCQPISPPNQPGSRACWELPANLALNGLCQEEAFYSFKQCQTLVGSDSHGGQDEAQVQTLWFSHGKALGAALAARPSSSWHRPWA